LESALAAPYPPFERASDADYDVWQAWANDRLRR